MLGIALDGQHADWDLLLPMALYRVPHGAPQQHRLLAGRAGVRPQAGRRR
jgi:hypothetical protein